MDIQRTTTRVRRTFAYPDDSTSAVDSEPEVLDEQEQEDLIDTLAAQNSAHNDQFRYLLLALPVLSLIPYLINLFHLGYTGAGTSGAAVSRFVALLALTSLSSTAWMLWTLPANETGIRVLDAWAGASQDLVTTPHVPTGRRRRRGSFSVPGAVMETRQSPLGTWLPYLNVGLCAVLVLTGLLSSQHKPQSWGHVGLGNLPGLVYAVVLAAKMVMGSVDPERELGGLKYEYKGA